MLFRSEPTATPAPDEEPETWNGTLIDLSNGKFSLFDDINLNIDNVTFDFATKNYTVNCYDIDFNYYTYNIQYTYNNTYVTYIGSTAEFQSKEYEFYYQLPDGRSSADLTEEDVAGLSFQFADVVNYKRGVTDTSLLALYHFDGDTDDDSFYSSPLPGSTVAGGNYKRFAWNKGASLTYMESNSFNGALYLDEKEHEFTIGLPKALGSDNFTLQFRYYQNSATTTDNVDNYISSNGITLFGWSEQYMYSYPRSNHGFGREKLSTGLSVGTWQEIALMRVGGTLYIYHNGIVAGTANLSEVLGSTITFTLGPGSKAYGMLDELRVLDFAYVTDGSAYSPTVVPYDTNEVLILPDSAVDTGLVDGHIEYIYNSSPVIYYEEDSADYSVHVFDNPVENGYLCASGFTKLWPEWDDEDEVYLDRPGYWNTDIFPIHDNETVTFCLAGDHSGLGYGADGFTSVGMVPQRMVNLVGEWWLDTAGAAPVMPLGYRKKTNNSMSGGGLWCTGAHTFSIVFDDGSKASCTFNFPTDAWTTSTQTFTLSSGTRSIKLNVCQQYGTMDGTYSLQYLCLYGGAPFRFFEMVKGTAPNPHQFVYDTVDTSDSREFKPNTAAIRSSIPVNGYTVGGVRPTFPKRGDVWFSVDGRRISGVQMYNGRMWEAVEARWWTGSRWIPIYAFDIVTLADMWDVSGSDGTTTTPPITSESGFWNWWKNQWLDFRDWVTGLADKVAAEWKDFRAWLESVFGPGESEPGEEDPPPATTLEPKTFVIDFSDVPQLESGQVVNYVCGTDNYFIANGNRVRRENKGVQFEDYTGYGYFTFGGLTKPGQLEQRSIKFTTNSADAVVKVWWESPGSGQDYTTRYVFLTDNSLSTKAPGISQVYSSADDETYAGRHYLMDTYSVDTPGTYYLATYGGDCRVYRVEVEDKIEKDNTSKLTQLIIDLVSRVGDLASKLISWVLDLASGAVSGLGSLGDFFREQAEKFKGYGGEFVAFLSAFFGLAPDDLMSLLGLSLFFLGLGLVIRKVLLS